MFLFVLATSYDCGNGIIEDGEECDDGNLIDGDGCSQFCRIEDNFLCNGEPSKCVNCSTITPSVNVINSKCFNSPMGEISVTIPNSQGYETYGVLYTNESILIGKSENLQWSSLSKGNYILEFTLNNRCPFMYEVEIQSPDKLETVSLDQNNITSCGGKNGKIMWKVSGGVGDYKYYFNQELVDEKKGKINNKDKTITIEKIKIGNYQLSLIDENQCQLSTTDLVFSYPGDCSSFSIWFGEQIRANGWIGLVICIVSTLVLILFMIFIVIITLRTRSKRPKRGKKKKGQVKTDVEMSQVQGDDIEEAPIDELA